MEIEAKECMDKMKHEWDMLKSAPLYFLGQNYQAMPNASLLSMKSQNGNYTHLMWSQMTKRCRDIMP